MCGKSSSAYVFLLFELIPTKRTPRGANFSAVFRVDSSEPVTYGQWLQVKKTTNNWSLAKSSSAYVFPSVAGNRKSGARSPICRVKLIFFSYPREEGMQT